MERVLAERFEEHAVRDITVPADGLISDFHGTPDYRAALITVMAQRAIAEAVADG